MSDAGSWELVSRQQDFVALQPEWERLFKRNPRHSPFQAWGWVDAWLRHIAGDHELRIVCHRNEPGELDFVLPLIRKKPRAMTVAPRIALACSYGPECSDYLGALRAPALDSALADLFAEAIARFFSGKECISLEALDGSGDFTSGLAASLRGSSRRLRISEDAACPVAALPSSWDSYTKELSSNFRSQVRRFHRKVARKEETAFRLVAADDARSFTSDLIRLNRSRIASKGEESSLEEQAFRRFLDDAVPYMAAAGLAWMDVIERRGKVIGTALNFVHGDTIYYYLGGFAGSASKLRPGTALFAEVIMRGIETGYARYNFLRGAEDYKYRWAATDEFTEKVTIYPAGYTRGLVTRVLDDMRVSFVRLARRSRRAVTGGG